MIIETCVFRDCIIIVFTAVKFISSSISGLLQNFEPGQVEGTTTEVMKISFIHYFMSGWT